jgi:RND family efflux transporter MFP subunit
VTHYDQLDPVRPGRALLLAAALHALVACSDGGVESVPALQVTTVPVQRTAGYTATRAFVGSVRSSSRVHASFDLSGRVTAVLPDDGAAVDSGARLAMLETDRLEARRGELMAAAESARAALSQRRNAAERLERTRRLDADAVGELALDDARDGVRAARAELERVEQQLARLELDIEKSVLRAPFDALVERRHVDPGAVVSPGTPVLTLLERTGREARIGISPAAAERLETGGRYPIATGAAIRAAKLLRLLPSEDARLRTVEAVFRFDDDESAPRPGDLATVEVEVDFAGSGFWLPLQALTASVRGLWAVYAVVPKHDLPGAATHVLERHEVEVLHERDSRVFVRSSLPDGARVVTTGVQRLTPGQAVRANRQR